MTEILLAAGAIMLASLGGVLFVHKVAEQFLRERLSYLVAFSAGVFLVTAGALGLEVFHLYEESLWLGVGLILGGYGLAWLLELFIPETHHHHDPTCEHSHSKVTAKKLIIGDAVHNLADGIILVPAFLASPALGMAVTVSIFIHEALQEISEFFVLKQAGYSTKRALLINFLVSGTILIGSALSYFALTTHDLEGLLLALSAGFFLHIVVHDLLPKHTDHETPRQFLQHLVFVAIGLAVMAGVSLVFGKEHTHGAAGEHVHDEHKTEEGDHDHDHVHE